MMLLLLFSSLCMLTRGRPAADQRYNLFNNLLIQRLSAFFLSKSFGGPEKGLFSVMDADRRAGDRDERDTVVLLLYFDEVYFVTAFVPSLTACFASSPGRSRRTAVWISRLVIVDRRL